MRFTNPNTYIQYVNDNGHIKTVEIDRQVEDSEIIYTTPPISENFFILGLFDQHQRVFGLTFSVHQNLDALGFLNSEFQTLEALPLNGFFPANTEVSIVKDTETYDLNLNSVPLYQDVWVQNFQDIPIYASCKNLTVVHYNRFSDAGNIPFFGISVNTYPDDVIGMVQTQSCLVSGQEILLDSYIPIVLFNVPFFYNGLWFKFHSAVASSFLCTFILKYYPNSNCFTLVKNYGNDVDAPVIDHEPKFIKTANGFVFDDEFGAMSLTVQDIPFE